MKPQNPNASALRESIAAALESGSPTVLGGGRFDNFAALFGPDSDLPKAGLRFDQSSSALVAEPFAVAFAAPIFIPFDFEQDPGDSAERRARSHMLRMASMLRTTGLPSVDEAIAAIHPD